MRGSFDKAGIRFTLKFVGGIYLLYIFVSVSSPIVFNDLYPYEKFAAGSAPITEVLVENKHGAVLGFVGDIMLDRGVGQVALAFKGGDFKGIFENVKTELLGIDMLFGNLEGPISDKGRDMGGLYSFRMAPRAAEALVDVGFDVLSFSNNHSGDWGEEALIDTVERLKSAGIGVAGAGASPLEAYSPVIMEVKGVRVAMLSFAENVGMYRGESIAYADEEKVAESVSSAADPGVADFVVAHFHFGDEYKSEPNASQQKLARLAIDSGADLVVGSHPHVTQTIEKYNGGLIVYSLGNFIFDQNFSDETMRGWLAKIHLVGHKIDLLEICQVVLNSLFQPIILGCTSENISY